ncbi:glycosyl transferase [Patescibacteria group bacterium]|nr:glycosyl transferase [Patescibacteria group bacterium]
MKRFVLVTLFDSNYLAKGLVNYYSLQKYLKNFVLYAYCFDELSYEAISKLNLKNLVAIRFSDFEDKMLLKIKGNKDRLYEYYWACVPFVIEKTLQRKEAEYVTYMDADLMFFSNPSTLFDFSKDVDVLIQPNNFSYNETHQFDPVGYYCSGWVTFRDNPGGRRVLEWWNRQCLKWCSARFKDGKFGDQKYLDDWRFRFNRVQEIAEVGSSIAPWNVNKYDISNKGGRIFINNKWPLIYYHYHSFRMNLLDYKYIIEGDRNNNYTISNEVKGLIYESYINNMKKVIKDLKNIKGYCEYVKLNPRGNYHINKSKIK